MEESGQQVCISMNEAESRRPERCAQTKHIFLFAGGGLCGGCSADHLDFEVLTPPYLYNADGTTSATRPSIQSLSSSSAIAGSTVSVTMNTAGGHTFAMIKASAATHGVNNDQRRLPLQLVSQSSSTFSLLISANVNVALPGYYFLFAMNAAGVPSIGETFRIDL
jgi:galactose oxidase